MRIAVEVVLQMAANYDAGMTHSEAEYEQGVIAARMRDGLAQFERKEP
jgi:hypothetical protein